MDGARRVLRSLREQLQLLLPASARPAAAGAPYAAARPAGAPYAAMRPQPVTPRFAPRRGMRAAFDRCAAVAARPGVGLAAAALLFAVVGTAGFRQSGAYADLVARDGEVLDIAARAFGFRVSAVTISGQTQLRETEILAAAGVGPKNSLPFLDATAVRDRLLQVPLIKSARVAKLYPDRLVIAVEEREPYALWQLGGKVMVIAQDGKAIDELHDDRFLGLPFVVGEGAAPRVAEFTRFAKAFGDLAPRIKAGVFVAGRRWNIDMTNGVTVKLPERNADEAIATLVKLQQESRLLEKDIVSIDLRTPGQVAVRLSEQALASREAAASRKSHKSGG